MLHRRPKPSLRQTLAVATPEHSRCRPDQSLQRRRKACGGASANLTASGHRRHTIQCGRKLSAVPERLLWSGLVVRTRRLLPVYSACRSATGVLRGVVKALLKVAPLVRNSGDVAAGARE